MALKTLRFFVLLVAALLVALLLYAGEPTRLSWWPAGLLFAAWVLSPVIVPLVLARRFRERPWLVYVMTGFCLLSGILAAWAYYDALVLSRSSTAALILIFFPLYQWVAFGCVGLFCFVADRWGIRYQRE